MGHVHPCPQGPVDNARRPSYTLRQLDQHLLQRWRNPELLFEYWRQRRRDTKETEVCARARWLFLSIHMGAARLV